jgi:predicted ATPase/DNA-binding CsgD family transcriptional regulator
MRVEHSPVKATAKGGRQPARRAVSNNLPHYLTSFVGRKSELPALKTLLARGRLVTLIGPGGAGKSRLAAEVGRATLDLWPDGAWWVDLAPVSDPRQVAGAVASALQLTGRGPAEDVVIAWLAAKRALLVLDNCEHLVAACAEFCQAALERCPELTILATSREALGVPGEAQWPVSSLQASDAVPLFEARGALVRPDFKVSARNLDAVTQICERVDRLPLAIELAASRVGMLTEDEILSQLSDRFHVLTGGTRTAPERQQTMRATIDWSYRLLHDQEALLFRRLSVFRGGFTLESVQAVCGTDLGKNVLDLLSGLVQKSMVVADRKDVTGTRYRLLEAQLAYAEEELSEEGELDLMLRHHYEYFRDLLDAKSFTEFGERPPPSLAESQRIALELANLWAAVEWARSNAEDLGLSLAITLSQTSFVDIAQARILITDVLNRFPEKGVQRAHALRVATWLAYFQGDDEAVGHHGQDALALAREFGDVEALAHALVAANLAPLIKGDLDAAAELMQEADSVLRGSSYRVLANTIRNNLGWIAVQRGDYSAGRDQLLECVASAASDGDSWLAATFLESLAWAQWGLNDEQSAKASFKAALAQSRAVTNKPAILDGLQGLLCVAAMTGDDPRTLRLAAAANRLSGEWSFRSERWVEKQAEESQGLSRSRLGARRSDEAWNQGWAMTMEQAIDYALHDTEPTNAVAADPLTRREREVAGLLAAGMTNRQIAERLFIAERSAEGHVERIRNKLGVRSRTEVATWAVEYGLKVSPVKERGTRHGSLSS